MSPQVKRNVLRDQFILQNAHSSDFAPQSIVVMLSKVETLTGIEEVMKICELRMRDLVIDESGYSRL